MSAFNQFALSLYHHLRTDSDSENVFFSPLSIYTALSMVYAGARGKTADEIKESLRTVYGPEDENAHKRISNLWGQVVSANKELTLNLANNIWLQESFKITDEYKAVMEKHFAATPTRADFVNNHAEVRKEINGWVESQTNNKIKDLIPDGALNSLTRLVLVNAIYFYGEWANAFSENSTMKRDFFVTKEKKKEVDTMYQKNDYKYLIDKDLESTLISLPYKGSSTSCIIILPNQVDGLKSLEDKILANIEENQIDTLFTKLKSSRAVKVQVYIPKFKFEHSIPLKKHLMLLGVKDLFSENNANLSGVAASNELYVSDAFHKAFIEVNEKGTEAAAATAMIMMTRCAMIQREIIFKADHPFLFFLYDSETKLIMFMGKVVDLS